ncbi:MAG: hypothetical protein LBP53_06180 [Candidatus Peribacteria bacterium]|nr:hypothetical protein [Candidatus Peribacteria bacterium]
MSKLGLTVGIAASLFLMSQKLKGQTTDNLAHNLQQTEETRGTALTSENFLTSLGVNITDPNEKKLIETVR